MNRSQKVFGYVLAFVGCTLMLLARLAVDEALAEQARLLPFVLAVMAAAFWGGLGPGLLATFLGALFGVLFIVPPPFSFHIDAFRIDSLSDGLNLAIFVIVGITISFLCDALHRAWRHETEKKFRHLADSMPQLVWMARPDGYRFWFNRRWYDYTGTVPKDVLGFGWQQCCDAAERPRLMASWEAARKNREPWEDTYPLRRSDGELRWHLVRAVPIKNEKGEVVTWFGTSTDIQDRIAAEQALKDADLRKNQFMAVLAHELRNPLSPINNALQLWPFVSGDRAKLEQLRAVMERQVQQLIRLIDDLMDLSRITQGKIQLRKERIDFRSIVAEAVEAVQPAVDVAGHRLTVTAPNEPVFVCGDVVRLRQVFSNILSNAAKYAVDGGEISVCMEQQQAGVVVRVRDNGAGIPPEMLNDIFEPFRQVDATLSRSHGGLGIGLWLAKQIVELQGGTIEALSEGLGQGSEFVVTLPMAIPADVSGASGNTFRLSSDDPSARRYRILVVDDVAASATTLAMLLEHMGHDATAVNDGEAAIEWVLVHHPDVVFLDIAMPKLDGYEVARRLRAHAELQDVVLVALTGYGQQEDQQRALRDGFDYHLTKPVGLAMLNGLLAKLSINKTTAEAVTV